jgi:cytochrome c oxidase cbb3-type subunit III
VLVQVLMALWSVNGLAARPQAPQQGLRQKSAKLVSSGGKQTFASTCANCHGLDGRGGERAPNIADRANVQRLSDAQISHIIENGIPGTGMPAFHSLDSSHIKAVVTYLRTLQGTGKPVKLPGNPARGEIIFLGKAGCSGCHMAAGKGGFIASDLSVYARTRTVEQIRNQITAPRNNDQRARMATAILRSGEKYTGRVRNEDNFSLQLQTLDGVFHFFGKSEIEGLEYSSQPLMPSNFGSTLSPDELNDVVSYLMSLAGTSAGPSEPPEKKFEDE